MILCFSSHDVAAAAAAAVVVAAGVVAVVVVVVVVLFQPKIIVLTPKKNYRPSALNFFCSFLKVSFPSVAFLLKLILAVMLEF